jgi:hypothetical protein
MTVGWKIKGASRCPCYMFAQTSQRICHRDINFKNGARAIAAAWRGFECKRRRHDDTKELCAAARS